MKNWIKIAGLLMLTLPFVVQAEDFTYTTNADNTITITGYTGTNGVLSIPSMINGLPVTRIRSFAFYNYPGLTGSLTIPAGVTGIGHAAFYNCSNLTGSLTIPAGVTNIGDSAFLNCSGLTGVYFLGNAPSVGSLPFSGVATKTIYYLPGTTNWTNPWANCPTALWTPQVQTGDADFGMRTNGFGFNINWASGMTVVVEACTNLTSGIWEPVATNTLTGESVQFSDPAFTNYPSRYYRVSMPQ